MFLYVLDFFYDLIGYVFFYFYKVCLEIDITQGVSQEKIFAACHLQNLF